MTSVAIYQILFHVMYLHCYTKQINRLFLFTFKMCCFDLRMIYNKDSFLSLQFFIKSSQQPCILVVCKEFYSMWCIYIVTQNSCLYIPVAKKGKVKAKQHFNPYFTFFKYLLYYFSYKGRKKPNFNEERHFLLFW